ncbi:N4 gp53-like protein [Sulfitobacter phage EE36phi1]|uniref:N4 gp53-like protein n=1 Tax=Sulfitobacter phage EE36phi1 TaxID=490913 RepID=C4NTE3_9CAUD|nr:N4 gp53-like protein [Sulfitobacter phage EE36phi1]ACL81409.1 N4 gp53-like protein [Sulfitobacter phage EE36phi1]
MGLFSSKKIINVSSTLYNMAGDENDRPDFIKGTLFGSVISNNPSLADDIRTSLFEGPGMKQRQFFRYADRNNIPGMVTTSIVNNVSLDALVVGGQIPPSPVPPAPAGLNLTVFSSEISDGDFQPWIEKWVLMNHPIRNSESWLGEYDPVTNTFSVEFPNNDFFSWLNDGTFGPVFSSTKRYVIAKYIEYLDNSESAVVEGTPTTNVLVIPDLTSFTQDSNTGTFTPVTLQRTRTTVWRYNNGDPDQTIENAVDADVAGQLSTAQEVWSREVIVQQNGITLQGERQIWNLTGTDTIANDYVNVVVTQTDLGGGVIRTETATTTGERVLSSWTTRYDTQDLFYGEQYGPEQIFIYEVGTGNAVLDALVSEADASGFQEFFPFMPIRINNVSITEPQYEDAYNATKKAYRRAYQGKNFDNLITSVEENPSINDIDYAYLCFGASLNVKENACKKYIFNFLEKMIPFQSGGSGNVMTNFQAEVAAYNAALQKLEDWENTNWEQQNVYTWQTIPPRPELPTISPPPTNTIRLRDSTFGFDYRVSWVHIEIEQFAGTYDTDPNTAGTQAPKVDDVMLANGPSFSWSVREGFNIYDGEQFANMVSNSIPSMYIYWQVSANSYRRITVWGLVSKNYIYGGKAVKITSSEALADNEESGFLIPLHYPTMSEMNIVDYTQMATANAHILFNSYTVTKQRWYQRGIFKILLVTLVIVIAVIIFPGAFAAGGGVLGQYLAVGAALGLTGTAALVAGVVANYIASIIISEILKVVGTALFGEKWGALFAAIAGFAFGAAMSGVKIFSAEGLLGLGNALANGYAGWVQGDINEMKGDLEEDGNAYEERMKYIQDLIDGLGGNDLNFNPLFLTEWGRGNARGGSRGYMPETADEYIRRTTMTGSDIVELTHSMVYDYVDVAKTLPRN